MRTVLALRPMVSSEPAWAGICDRCQDALAEAVMDEALSEVAGAPGVERRRAPRRLEIWLPLVIVASIS